ncbi:MAG TPA: multiheme c-type cytochrome [Bacteroidota bacterium]|nr:multiheme c-type cytochrome [Bacteroidota bacterium]
MNIAPGVYVCLLVLGTSGALSQSKYATLGPSGCGVGQNNCHAAENKQMIDKHKNSVDDIVDNEDARKYAELSGIGAANFLKGTSRCMECHGTIITGKEGKEVEEGVSCESCHGPGSGYKDAHAEGPKGTPGSVRPGYTKSLPLGLKDLKTPEVLADACVRCHLITDQKILAAGHPDGAKFNYKSGMKSVAKHWKYRDPVNIPEQSVFKAVAARKGPAGIAMKPAKAPAPPKTAPKPAVRSEAPPPKPSVTEAEPEAPVPVRRPPPPPKPVPAVATAPQPAATPVELPPFPNVTDSTRVDQLLFILKKRLELLYRKTGS